MFFGAYSLYVIMYFTAESLNSLLLLTSGIHTQIDRRSMATGLWRAEGKLSRILLSDVQKVILFLSYVHTIDNRRS